jgi:hypothetical protein
LFVSFKNLKCGFGGKSKIVDWKEPEKVKMRFVVRAPLGPSSQLLILVHPENGGYIDF